VSFLSLSAAEKQNDVSEAIRAHLVAVLSEEFVRDPSKFMPPAVCCVVVDYALKPVVKL
jgi:hypothetical protein